jgi:hypothetical protein
LGGFARNESHRQGEVDAREEFDRDVAKEIHEHDVGKHGREEACAERRRAAEAEKDAPGRLEEAADCLIAVGAPEERPREPSWLHVDRAQIKLPVLRVKLHADNLGHAVADHLER